MAKHLLVLFCLLQHLQELMFVNAALSGHKYFHHALIPALLLNIKTPKLYHFRSLKTWTVIYFEAHEWNARFCWRSLDLCLLWWSAFGYSTAPTSAFLIQCVGRHETSSEVYQPNLWLCQKLSIAYNDNLSEQCTVSM
jgi:hypothetical protein